MEKTLTIGMATYNDLDGVFFTVQALRMYHLQGLESETEIVVIDNNPDGSHGKEVKKFVQNWAKQKYIPYTAKKSTSVRNEVFKNASGKYTLCLDSHVLIEAGGIKKLIEYYKANPETNYLLQGPLWHDDLKTYCTQFNPEWRENMFGIWGKNKEAYEKGEPFEIPSMGLGLFTCRTAAWQGFNEKFRGFGGEEGYIHEKFRRAGGKCLCLPWLKWNHRFYRPAGIAYPNLLEDRVWNYFIGWLEILKDPDHPFIEETVQAFTDSLPEPAIRTILERAKAEYGL